jgi:flagellar basal-body rod modification protein FlgD
MTTVPPVGSTSDTNAASAATKKADVDYQSFLKLLVAQMKNQDPTQPMDSTQYVAQLAQFSNVEQSIQVNTKLNQLLQISAITQADSILGRTVTSSDGKISGVVAQVKLATNGVIAVLQNGTEMVMENGVTVKETPGSNSSNTSNVLDPAA